MRVLQLCHKPPFPGIDGGCIAMGKVTRGLLEAGQQVRILTAETHKHPFQPEQIPEDILRDTGIEAIPVNTRLDPVDAFANLITQDPYNVSRFFSPDMDIRLVELLQTEAFDVIHLESLFMTPYIDTIRKFSDARVIFRSHNLEYMIWQRMAQGESNLAKRTYFKLLSRQLRDYERRVLGRMDGIASISKEDAQRYRNLGCDVPIRTIPFGMDIEGAKLNGKDAPSPLRLFHLGSMDWLPNREGVDWLLNEVWPLLLEKQPEATLYLAGRNMPEEFFERDIRNVHVLGEVTEALSFMNEHGIMLVPILSGSGIRVKIIEGMALGKPIVSTRVGAAGIEYTDRENIMIGDSPSEFAESINELVETPRLRDHIGRQARTLVEEKYDDRRIISQLIELYKELGQEA